MSESRAFAVRVVARLRDIDRATWDACAGADDPFVSYAFLDALEESGSASAKKGWQPQHLIVEDEGRVLGVAPLYAKGHSYGEYVFDWSWANAAERVGIAYYPKLQCCVPFTPVGGRRLLVHPGADAAVAERVLLGAMLQLTRELELSSLHLTFLTAAEAARAEELGMLARSGVQYHWHNRGYRSYDDFLASLVARKRKAMKKERRRAQESGLDIRTLVGADVKSEHWDALYRFYKDTTGRKWGRSSYLTRELFELLGPALGDAVVLVLAFDGAKAVAGALHLRGKRALYGRYWGATAEHPFVHFECCYHRAIDLAIELGLERVEAGAQGEHKMLRGYLPVETHSAHFVAHPALHDGIRSFLERERAAVRAEIAELSATSPYRDDRGSQDADVANDPG
jgi:predicted N-acyltransferase